MYILNTTERIVPHSDGANGNATPAVLFSCVRKKRKWTFSYKNTYTDKKCGDGYSETEPFLYVYKDGHKIFMIMLDSTDLVDAFWAMLSSELEYSNDRSSVVGLFYSFFFFNEKSTQVSRTNWAIR